ncbi:MAG: histidinol dehydrogenase [Planctomycetota bacterium]
MLKILPLAEADSAIEALRTRLAIFEKESSARAAALTRKVFGRPLSPAQVVERIVNDVRARGDEAVAEYTVKLDGAILTPDMFRVEPATILKAEKSAPKDFVSAVRFAADNVRAYQRHMLHPDRFGLSARESAFFAKYRGSIPGEQWRAYSPVHSAACYVPGGLAPYPSTVIMSAVPAQVAGVPRIAVVTPPRKGKDVDPLVLATCGLIGVDEVYRIGGVQAIAALAFGTETIPKVDKIVGPGNLFVMLAKKSVYGHVDIDMFAGPSEILVIADGKANAAFVAADLLSQAEHDEMASAILVTDSRGLAQKVAQEIEAQLPKLSRAGTARASIDRFGLGIIVPSMDAAVDVANDIAPEHLEVLTENADEIAWQITCAGAVFIGPWTPEAVGDYVAGSSHILPTGGTAKFFSGLSANSFLRATSFVKYDKAALDKAQAAIQTLAKAEGYDAHGKSAAARSSDP